MIFRCESCDALFEMDANPGFCLVCGQGPILELICLTPDEARQIEGALRRAVHVGEVIWVHDEPTKVIDTIIKDNLYQDSGTALDLIRAKMEGE